MHTQNETKKTLYKHNDMEINYKKWLEKREKIKA